MSQATQAPVVTVPPEVLAFAVEQGVDSVLPAVLEMTQRIFPDASLGVEIEDDAEIADDRHIVVLTRVGILDVPKALEDVYRWHGGLFACCPAPLVCVFRLGLR